MAGPDPDPIFFADAAAFADWLADHHAHAAEVWVGMHKAHTGVPSPRWAQLVPEALRYGWIDGQSRRIDADRMMQRYTPRRSRRWSAVNVRLVAQLRADGRMHPAGEAAFARRDPAQDYSVSDRPDGFPPEWEAVLRADPAAAAFWDTLPPSYRKTCVFWVTDAKRPATRERRMAELQASHARGERLARFTSSPRG